MSLGVKRSGFYARVRRGQGLRQKEDKRLGEPIGEILGAKHGVRAGSTSANRGMMSVTRPADVSGTPRTS